MHEDTFRGLAWAHGILGVESLAGMLAPVTFVLADGRQVNPLYVAPWTGEPGSDEIPGLLRRIRGEWPCVPFGYTVPPDDFAQDWQKVMRPMPRGEEAHGYSSNHHWTFVDSPADEIRLAIEYPSGDPVRRLERFIRPDPNAAAIDIELRVEVREDCRLPIGLHPCLRLPSVAQGAVIEPGKFTIGWTYPGVVAPGTELFAANQRFADLRHVPLRTGGTVDASRIPLADDTEELLELTGIDGTAALANQAEGYRLRVTWQKEHFPNLLLWYSNRGRKMAPWNGRNVCLGMEPICSPFGFAVPTAAAENPMSRSGTATAHDFRRGEPFLTRYRIAVEALSP